MEVLSEGCPVRALCLPVATGEATGEAAEDVKAQGRSGSCATPARMLPFSCANITSRASTGSAQGSSVGWFGCRETKVKAPVALEMERVR